MISMTVINETVFMLKKLYHIEIPGIFKLKNNTNPGQHVQVMNISDLSELKIIKTNQSCQG